MFDTSQYTIGWVCALPPELVAARLHLDTEHSAGDYEAPPNDNNTYIFGAIGKHNVVIAALPRGQYGISSAASVARDMVRSFTNIRVGLMVGIGGGAPLMEQDERRKQDIRLGDVVVSVPGNGEGGVVQYDYGKTIQDREFLLTGHLNSPPTSLLAAVIMLGTDFDILDYDLNRDVVIRLESCQGKKLWRDYRRPDADTDRLFKSSFVHPDDSKSCSSTCQFEEQILKRCVRDEGEEVAVHYGLVASADTLVQDATLRNKLARDHSVLCFEMEAAGLMNQFPFLIVRGIWNYSDTQKQRLAGLCGNDRGRIC